MPAELLKGKPVADAINDRIGAAVAQLRERGVTPQLVSIVAGHDPGTEWYVGNQAKQCEKAGMAYARRDLDAAASESDVLATIDALNNDPAVHGIILQLPLPKGVSVQRCQFAMRPEKDVEGVGATNLGRLILGGHDVAPCTVAAAFAILDHYKVPVAGARVAIVGRSSIVGKPAALLALLANATPTVCHTKTKDLAAVVREADIVIAAAGVPGIVTQAMVKPGATVIDVGTNEVPDPDNPGKTKMVGDVSADVAEVAGKLTPVPGGVGPVTTRILLEQTVRAAARAAGVELA
jgi:methylenetetrahydrofolate dehydrogenase (NADP+)/methenyltetrahydrofolate cyclohydrolase